MDELIVCTLERVGRLGVDSGFKRGSRRGPQARVPGAGLGLQHPVRESHHCRYVFMPRKLRLSINLIYFGGIPEEMSTSSF